MMLASGSSILYLSIITCYIFKKDYFTHIYVENLNFIMRRIKDENSYILQILKRQNQYVSSYWIFLFEWKWVFSYFEIPDLFGKLNFESRKNLVDPTRELGRLLLEVIWDLQGCKFQLSSRVISTAIGGSVELTFCVLYERLLKSTYFLSISGLFQTHLAKKYLSNSTPHYYTIFIQKFMLKDPFQLQK